MGECHLLFAGAVADASPPAGRFTRRPLVLALLAGPCVAAPRARPLPVVVEGRVTHVHDGDSLWIQPAGEPAIEVRLSDIDAPEICQPWGPQARDALAGMALHKPAVLRINGHDGYGRTLGKVSVDDEDLGRRLVEQGHAWSARSRWDEGPLVKQERLAMALRRGLHALGQPQPPWQFRKAHGPCPRPEKPDR